MVRDQTITIQVMLERFENYQRPEILEKYHKETPCHPKREVIDGAGGWMQVLSWNQSV